MAHGGRAADAAGAPREGEWPDGTPAVLWARQQASLTRRDAQRILTRLGERGQSLGVAESLTGGLLAAAITAVPGASQVFRGGIVAYAAGLKAALLDVPRAVLAEHGPVHPEVAEAMAAGARKRLGADIGVATTGVAGPGPADGHPPGTVHVGLCTARVRMSRALMLAGGRDEVRQATVTQALRLLWSVVREESE